MKVLLRSPLPDALQRAIREMSSHIEFEVAPLGEPLPRDALAKAEVLYATYADFEIEAAPCLRWLQLDSAAANHILDKPIGKSEVPITTVRGAYSVAVAECAMAMLLAVSRRIPKACRLQNEHVWDDVNMQGVDLFGKTLGIIGYGSIGRQIGRIANAMGMRVLACKRDPQAREYSGYSLPNSGDPDGAIPEAWYGINQLSEMLSQCDVAIITLPLTPHTKDMLGKHELSSLPSHAFLINIGRGGVVDESTLLEMLQNAKLAGAAFDVFATEPLPPESPLWNAPNFLVMPHVASWTTSQSQRAGKVLVENMRRYLAGDSLLNIVDRKWMY